MTQHAATGRTRQLAALDVDECLALLATRSIGRIAFLTGQRPTILPVNYFLHTGTVVFRYAFGTVMEAVPGQWVAFEVDETDPVYQTGWSVVVEGKAEEVWRVDELAALRDAPLRPWAPGDRSHYIRILSTAVTGRRIS